jgi:ribosome biogenesis GTPase
MRELKVAGVRDALGHVFDDIEALGSGCRFSDCRHENEPGCAVRRAVESGKLEARRLRNYLKLQREDARNSASLAEKRSQDRDFAKHVRQVKARKQADRKRS